jgi:CO/xanthine dehydrogenase Mo-binding subunit
MQETIVLGTGPRNIDGPEKLSGRARYAIDMVLPGMLHGRILRSPHPHARIVSIDASRALAIPGVMAVVTGADLPVLEDFPGDRPTLAQGIVRYVGDAVAAIAAETTDLADEALRLIDVTYDPLPAILDPETAMAPDALRLHASIAGPDGAELPPNVCHYYGAADGDLEAGFAAADLIVENRYTTGMAQCTPMEPHAALADVDIYGNVTVWSNTQTPYMVKNRLAALLRIPSHKVRVLVPPHIGGGFGCKTRMKAEGFAAALSRLARRPVKVVFSREEVFADTTVKHPFVIYVRDGVMNDGTLVARQVRSILDAGAYTDGTVGGLVTRNAAYGAVGVYKVPNFKLDNYRVYTNKPVGGAFRGFGVAQTTWAIESQMDIIADRLGIDPLELRLKNLMADGDLNPEQFRMDAVGSRPTVLRAAREIGWGEPLGGGDDGATAAGGGNGLARRNGTGAIKRGRGIAIGCKHFSIQTSAASIRVNEDGTFEIRSSVTDIGQGSRTIMAQIVAEEFRVPLERVTLHQIDTDVTPLDTGQSGSSTTVKAGHAVRLACIETRRKLFERAAKVLEAAADDLETADGEIFVTGSPAKSVSITGLFKSIPVNMPGSDYGPFLEDDAEIIGGAIFYPSKLKGADGGPMPKVGFSYCSQAVEVEVDTETGRIKVLKLVSILDPGKALNTTLTDGQIEGGVGFGIGTALLEELQFRDGALANGNLTDYRIPTALDVPEIANLTMGIEETDYANGPYGAKGIGEVVVCATAAAIANAVFDATGVRLTDMPMTPERVALALAARASGGGASGTTA